MMPKDGPESLDAVEAAPEASQDASGNEAVPIVMWKSGRPRSAKSVRRALKTYAKELKAPKYRLFAALCAEGATQKAAFLASFPHACRWKDKAVRNQASILAAHPIIQDYVVAYAINLASSSRPLPPSVFQRLGEVIDGMHGVSAEALLRTTKCLLARSRF